MSTPNHYNTYENVLNSKLKNVDIAYVSQRSVISKMVSDYVTGEPKAASEFTVFVKKIVKDDDRSICNVDPFHNTQDDKERMMDGTIKARTKRAAVYVEIPSFFIGIGAGLLPSSEALAFKKYNASKRISAWHAVIDEPSPFPLLRMDISNAKNLGGRLPLVNEVIIIKFKDQNNFTDPEFVRSPKGKTKVIADSPSQAGKSRKRPKNFHKTGVSKTFAELATMDFDQRSMGLDSLRAQQIRALRYGCKEGDFYDTKKNQCIPGKPIGQDVDSKFVPQPQAKAGEDC